MRFETYHVHNDLDLGVHFYPRTHSALLLRYYLKLYGCEDESNLELR